MQDGGRGSDLLDGHVAVPQVGLAQLDGLPAAAGHRVHKGERVRRGRCHCHGRGRLERENSIVFFWKINMAGFFFGYIRITDS